MTAKICRVKQCVLIFQGRALACLVIYDWFKTQLLRSIDLSDEPAALSSAVPLLVLD